MNEPWKYAEKQRKEALSKISKKEELKKEFIKKLSIKVSKEGEIENVENFNKYKELYRKLKVKYDGVCKENEDLRHIIRERSEHHNNHLNQKLEKAKLENYKQKELNDKIIKELSKNKNELEEVTKELASLQVKMNQKNVEYSNLVKLTDTVQYKLELTNKRNDDLQNILNNINGRIHSKYTVMISELKNENKSLKNLLNKRQEEIQSLTREKEKYFTEDPHFILQKLYDEMTINNVTSYFLTENITRKYKSTLDNYYRVNVLNEKAKEETHLFGYLKKIDYLKVFVDLDDKEYIVSKHILDDIKNNTPVAAFLKDDGTVEIYWVYRTDLLMKNDYKNHKDKQNSDQKAERFKIEYIGDFKVLILTSLNGNRYRDRLRMHGINAQWVDPFEKSPTHIKELMYKNDLVIMCPESMPHAVNNMIDENSEKYQFVTNHNEEKIFERVKSTAIRLGLIKEATG